MVNSEMNIKIEKTTTGYQLYVDDWFIGVYKTERELQEKIAERITHYLQ